MSSMPSCLAVRGRVPELDGLVQLRHLKDMGPWTGRERLRFLWYRLRLTVAEMNYATRRMVELQAPWITDPTGTSGNSASTQTCSTCSRSRRPGSPPASHGEPGPASLGRQ